MIPVNLEREEFLLLEANNELVCFWHFLITLFMLLFKSRIIFTFLENSFCFINMQPHIGKLLKSSLNFNNRIYND